MVKVGKIYSTMSCNLEEAKNKQTNKTMHLNLKEIIEIDFENMQLIPSKSQR